MKRFFKKLFGWGLNDMCYYGNMYFTRRWAQSVTSVTQYSEDTVLIYALVAPHESRIRTVNKSEDFAVVISGYAHYHYTDEKKPTKTA